MAGVASPTVVQATPARPPLHGLLQTLRALGEPYYAEGDGDWMRSVAWEPESCPSSGVGDPCDSPAEKDVELSRESGEAVPYYVWAGDRCTAGSFQTRDWQARAIRQLLATQSHQIASELWTGTLARAATPDWPNRYLASPLADNVTDAPTSPTDALACLESGIADCGQGAPGMIHATVQLAAHWDHLQLLRTIPTGPGALQSRLYETARGTLVVADSGYDGSSPDNAAASEGSQWAYGTDLVLVNLSDVLVFPDTLKEAMSRGDNDVVYRAERFAMARWEGCCHVAAEVDLSLCDIGGS